MSLANLKTDSNIKEEKDVLGGFSILPSGVYNSVIETAYLGESKGGALSLNLHVKTEDGAFIRETVYMTSGKAKGQLNYYTDKNGDKQYLPGFNIANAIGLLTAGKEIGDMATEEKVIKLYSAEANGEVPTKVTMFTELLGQPIKLGILEVHENKSKKEGDAYVKTNEMRKVNEISKIFRASDNMTVAEVRAQAETATFMDKWSDKNTGVVKDKFQEQANAPTAGAPAGAGTAAASPAPSLFANQNS